METAAGEAELCGGLDGRQVASPEAVEHMADERGRVAMGELLVLFKEEQDARRSRPQQNLVLPTTRLVLFCSPCDRLTGRFRTLRRCRPCSPVLAALRTETHSPKQL